MNSCKLPIVHERSNIIPIPQKTNNICLKELSLKQNFFDPSKSSPPNEFMLKLQLRMNLYDSVIKDDRRIIE